MLIEQLGDGAVGAATGRLFLEMSTQIKAQAQNMPPEMFDVQPMGIDGASVLFANVMNQRTRDYQSHLLKLSQHFELEGIKCLGGQPSASPPAQDEKQV